MEKNKVMKRILFIFLLSVGFIVQMSAKPIIISSLKELASYAAQSNNTVKLTPGVYKLTDYLNNDSIVERIKRKEYQYLNFTGSHNSFDLKGVEIEIDTKLRELLKFPIHTSEVLITGKDNVLSGLKKTSVGNGLSPGGATFEVAGEYNTIKDFIIYVQGSFPYGYGDLFGKGGPDIIRHKKQSGFLITGSNTKVLGCKLYMRAFGHGFFIQKSAGNILFENCYVEGELRATDDILKETEGPAFDVKFRTWTPNREGKYIVTPGYMKSLCEEGFRTYNRDNKNITFINCTAKNTRGGFELRTNGGVRLEDCTTIGTERAYWVGNDAVIKNCKGDANYGPLLFLEGSNVTVDLQIVPRESDKLVHSLITIQGKNNKVTLRSYKGEKEKVDLPILIGYTHPEHGESMSPYSEAPCLDLQLINKTIIPIVLGQETENCVVETKGEIQEDKGRNNTIKYYRK